MSDDRRARSITELLENLEPGDRDKVLAAIEMTLEDSDLLGRSAADRLRQVVSEGDGVGDRLLGGQVLGVDVGGGQLQRSGWRHTSSQSAS